MGTIKELSDQPLAAWATSKAGVVREIGYLGGVEIFAPPIAAHIANAAEVLCGLSVDSILKGFRAGAGLSAPGAGLAGWATETAESTFGQWVSSLARLSCVLGDAALAERAACLVEGYAATLPASGRSGMAIYGWEKLVCGLVDAAVFAGYEDAGRLLSKVVRAAGLDQARPTPTPVDPAGAGLTSTREWYTLPENLYRGFRATGDEALARFARLWHYDAYWRKFLNVSGPPRSWDVPVGLHAYSHVNTLASAAAVLDDSRDPVYLEILQNSHDWLLQTQCYATGGYGPAELTVATDGALGRALEWRTDSAEIICGTWAAFKLCAALLRHTGDVRYVDWPEKLLYNGLLAGLPLLADGRSPYYADYRLGCATKAHYWDEWPCCSGSYGQALSFVPNLVYQAVDDDGLAISLFVPSRARHIINGQPLTLEQRTQFPDEDQTSITIVEAPSLEVTIWLRLPGWADRARVQVNGSSPIEHPGGTWLALRRLWGSGDVVTARFSTRLSASAVDEAHPNRVALQRGPIVLAQDAAQTAPLSAPVPWHMVDWDEHLVRGDDQLIFHPRAPGSPPFPVGAFRPLYDFRAQHPYRVYLDLDRPRTL